MIRNRCQMSVFSNESSRTATKTLTRNSFVVKYPLPSFSSCIAGIHFRAGHSSKGMVVRWVRAVLWFCNGDLYFIVTDITASYHVDFFGRTWQCTRVAFVGLIGVDSAVEQSIRSCAFRGAALAARRAGSSSSVFKFRFTFRFREGEGEREIRIRKEVSSVPKVQYQKFNSMTFTCNSTLVRRSAATCCFSCLLSTEPSLTAHFGNNIKVVPH